MRTHLLVAAVLFSAAASLADVIVLKNGRRIIANSVWEEGGKVFYERQGGRISFPKSLVERIEKGGPAPPVRRSSPGATAGDDRLARELSSQIQPPQGGVEGVIREGAVDEQRLRGLAALADQGETEKQNAVNGYLTAASFEARQNRLAQASRWAERALRLSRRDLNALLLAARLDISRQQHSEAIDHLLLAESMVRDSPDVLTLLGYAYYYSDGAEKAARYWKRAYALRPDPKLQGLIRRTEREEQVEGGFEQAQSAHFALSWEGSEVSPSLSREVLDALERQYWELESALDFSPRQPIVVILYAAQQFMDITRAPGWLGALNDGKIRVPVRGLSSMTRNLARVLKHEMVHSFVHRQAQGRCPTWLNEGLAQAESGEDLSRSGPPLASLYGKSRQVPLAQLEGSFLQFDAAMASIAYGESQAAVEMIRDQYGAYQLPQLLQALGEGRTMAQALQQVLRLDYRELDAEVGSYLARRYGR